MSIPGNSINLKSTERSFKNLRVVVISDAAPERNGVGSYYYDLRQHLKKSVHSFHIISPQIIDGVWQGGYITRLPGDPSQKFCIPNFIELKKKLDELKPDVVVVPTPGIYGIAGAYYARRSKLPVMVGFHTWYEKLSDLYWNRLQGAVVQGYLKLSNQYLFRQANCVVANSESMISLAEYFGAASTQLVGTPISYDYISKPVTLPDEHIKKIIFAGRLAAEKNLDAIITAANDLPHIVFNVAGDGPERVKIESAATKYSNVNYLGWLDREQLMANIDLNDMLVLPSHVESFGTVALEAMARQRCVLVSENCGIAQWRELKSGFYCFPNNESLTAAIQRISKIPPDERLATARAARTAAVSLNRRNCRHWLNLFGSALN